MTTKAKAAEPAEVQAYVEPTSETTPAAAKAKRKVAPGECVVDDGTAHMGGAVHGGLVCSAHEMHYHADGTRRGG